MTYVECRYCSGRRVVRSGSRWVKCSHCSGVLPAAQRQADALEGLRRVLPLYRDEPSRYAENLRTAISRAQMAKVDAAVLRSTIRRYRVSVEEARRVYLGQTTLGEDT